MRGSTALRLHRRQEHAEHAGIYNTPGTINASVDVTRWQPPQWWRVTQDDFVMAYRTNALNMPQHVVNKETLVSTLCASAGFSRFTMDAAVNGIRY